MIQTGDKLPSVPVKLVDNEGVKDLTTLDVLGKGRVVLFGLPGAFTPTCDTSHLPGFIANAGKLKAAVVTRIVCAAPNDHHVVKAMAERSEALGAIDFIADPRAEFADALGLSKDTADLGHRYARFAMIIRDGVVDQLFVQDVAGVTVSGAPAILLALQGAHAQ
jgi:glutaredoxin/glutathione-dependent peroxiredoxin